MSWLLEARALLGREGAELRGYLSLFAALVCETDNAGEEYRSVVARLDDELVSHCATVECGADLLQATPLPCQFTLKLSAELDKTTELVMWADRLVHECEFPEERVLSTCRRIVTSLKERMRDGESVMSEVLTAMSYSP